nr:hypothetical protein [Tanacetum cinerariifolium]
MLEKDMYDSWKSKMELYMLNRQHGRMILEFVKNGPLLRPIVKENGVTRLKKYSELPTTETIQADCDVKATNIILQGLPPESAEISDLNASLQEKVLAITALKDTLSKIKEKAVVNEAVLLYSIDPELLKIDVAPLAPKLRNNRTAHTDYLRHTQEETATLREIVKVKDCLIQSILP